MAYALKYYKNIILQSGSTYRLEIYKKDSTAAAVEIGAVLQALSLDIQGQQDDIDAPIVKTSLSMTFVDAGDIEDGRKNGFWEEFYTPDALLWQVRILRKEDDTFYRIWCGYVTPDSYSENLTYRGSVTIIARDNIGHLQDFPFDAEGDADGMISFRDLVNTAWSKIDNPMNLAWSNSSRWLHTGGVSACDTLMNVSAFEGKNWYEALEDVLYAYGAVLRYRGYNSFCVVPLRDLPQLTIEDIKNVEIKQPVFVAGATRELVPAVKRIEESVEYSDAVYVAKLPTIADFSGETITPSTGHYDLWVLKNKTSGRGWCNRDENKTLFVNPKAHQFIDVNQFGYSPTQEQKDEIYSKIFLNCGIAGEVEYSRYVEPKPIKLELSFSNLIFIQNAEVNGTLQRLITGWDNGGFETYLKTISYAISITQNGITYWLQSDGSFDTQNSTLTYNFERSGSRSMAVEVDLSKFGGRALFALHIMKITAVAGSEANWNVALEGLVISANDSFLANNNVNTNYNSANNIIISRSPKIAPTFATPFLPAFIKNGIFIKKNDVFYTTSLWSWQGSSAQQMAVWQHLSLLAYYAKPNNLISGTITNVELANHHTIYQWSGKEHILVSGSYNILTGQIDGAMLREYTRYDSLWGNIEGDSELPALEQNSKSNIESGAGTSNVTTYENTTDVNIVSIGGGGTGASYLNDLLDVNVDGVSAQSILFYNGTEWIAQSKSAFLKNVTDRIVALEDFWYDEQGYLCTDKDIRVKGNIIAEGEVSAGGVGEEGESSGEYKMYHHKQAEPSNEWRIEHYLGKMPNVKIVDSNKQLCLADVIYDNTNVVTIKFNSAESGDAYLD